MEKMGDPLSLSLLLGAVLAFAIFFCVRHRSLDWLRSTIWNSGGGIPKGSLGWPILGETVAFVRDPLNFTAARIQSYGRVFKTSLFGQRVILGTSSEFAKFVLTKNTLFGNYWPKNITETLGKKSFFFTDGQEHMPVKRMFQKSLLPEAVRDQVGVLEEITLQNLVSWAERGAVISSTATRALTMEMGLYVLLGIRNITATPEGSTLVEDLLKMSNSLWSIPVNLPGTTFSKGVKAKKAVAVYFKNMIQQRRSEGGTGTDMLGVVLASMKDPQAATEVKNLDDQSLIDSFVHVWFGSYDTLATTLLWCIKLLFEHPHVLRRVQAEQQEIRQSKARSGQPSALTWEDLKAMEYTTKFWSEILRFTSVTSTLFRRALQETQFEGQRIPKGWSVVTSLRSVHYNPPDFPDPSNFDPSRFASPPKPYTIIPFGAGMHTCIGIELAKVVTLIFVHHITTTFTYYSTGSVEENSKMTYLPFMAPQNGYPINFSRVPSDQLS